MATADDHGSDDLRILAPYRLTRRQALYTGGAGALSLWLAACGGSSGEGGGGGGDDASGSQESVSSDKPIEDELLVANWIDYSDPANYKGFTSQKGPKISTDGYGSNDELLAKLNAGGSAFDIVVPTGYAVKTMIDKGLALKLNRELLPNLANLQPKFTQTEYDRGNQYSVPKDYGITSFYWRTAVVDGDPKTLAEAYEMLKEYEDARVNFLEGSTQNLGTALNAVGYSLNSEDEGEIDEAKELLLSVKPYVDTISSTYIPRGEKGDIDLGIGWNGDVARIIAARAEKDDEVKFMVPEGKTEYWVDNWVIPADAKNPVAAHAWINFMLDPKRAARETEYHQYPVPVRGVEDIADKAITGNPVIYVDPAQLEEYETQIQTPAGSRLRDRAYTEFKAA